MYLKLRSPLTLLHEGSVDDPDGALKRGGGRRRRVGSGEGLRADRLDATQQEDHDPDHGDGGGNAGPHRQVEGRQEREDVDVFLRLPH